MGTKTLIMASSGSGKSTSLRNLNPEKSVVIQCIPKPLPFPNGKNWKYWDKDKQAGSKFVTRDMAKIQAFISKMVEVGKEVIIIDDFVYAIAGDVMDRVGETGFTKWTELALQVHTLFEHIDTLPDNVRVYILTHTEEDAEGNIKMKTAGKLIDNLLTPAGMFSMVLGATFINDEYKFVTNKTRNSEPYKTPMGMFKDRLIDNDLDMIDKTICEYYGLGEQHDN